MNELKSNREVKSSAFTAYFAEPKNAAMLYEALEPSGQVSEKDISFTTLSGVLFMARKNDMAFQVKNKVLVISEHQSTINWNMPLRNAIYYGRTMEKLVESQDMYKEKMIAIPTPEFFVFYNGDKDFPQERILKLSDAYLEQTQNPMLELIVKIININLAVGHPILKKCRPLYEYSWFIQRIKDYIKLDINREEAIIKAISDCETEGIMSEFLREHGTEAVNMLFTQFNVEDALNVRYEEGKEEGVAEGDAERLIKSVKNVMKSLECDLQKACCVLEVKVKEYETAKQLVESQNRKN